MRIKSALLIALGTGCLLLIPFIAKWPWTSSDFIVAGALIFIAGMALDVIWRKAGKYRVIASAVLVLLFLWLWAELAVGLFTNWGS
jgi:hypothetical protein